MRGITPLVPRGFRKPKPWSPTYYGLGRPVTVRALAEFLRCEATRPAYVLWLFARDWGMGHWGWGWLLASTTADNNGTRFRNRGCHCWHLRFRPALCRCAPLLLARIRQRAPIIWSRWSPVLQRDSVVCSSCSTASSAFSFKLHWVCISSAVPVLALRFSLFDSRSRPARPWIVLERCDLFGVVGCLLVEGGWGGVIALVAMSVWWISRPRR